jgi:hypothetical protein
VTRGKVIATALMLSASLACSDDPTQLLVVVDSDMEVPGEISEINAEIRNEKGKFLASNDFKLIAKTEPTGAMKFRLPLSFGVLQLFEKYAR